MDKRPNTLAFVPFVHEAAHFCIALHERAALAPLDFSPADDWAGLHSLADRIARLDAEARIDTRLRRAAEAKIRVALAGRMAGQWHAPDRLAGNDGADDVEAIIRLLDYVCVSDREASALKSLLIVQAEEILSQPEMWGQVLTLADALYEHRHLSATVATHIVRAVQHRATPKRRGRALALA